LHCSVPGRVAASMWVTVPPTPRPAAAPAGQRRHGPQLTQRLLRRADRHRRMRGLVRIHPDHHCRHGNTPSLPAGKDRGGHAQFQDLRGAHPSFEPRHGEAPARWHVVRKPAPRGGRRLESQANRDLSTLRPDSLPSRPGSHRLPKVSIGRHCALWISPRVGHTTSGPGRSSSSTDRRGPSWQPGGAGDDARVASPLATRCAGSGSGFRRRPPHRTTRPVTAASRSPAHWETGSGQEPGRGGSPGTVPVAGAAHRRAPRRAETEIAAAPWATPGLVHRGFL
jgi:hypothetical protein